MTTYKVICVFLAILWLTCDSFALTPTPAIGYSPTAGMNSCYIGLRCGATPSLPWFYHPSLSPGKGGHEEVSVAIDVNPNPHAQSVIQKPSPVHIFHPF